MIIDFQERKRLSEGRPKWWDDKVKVLGVRVKQSENQREFSKITLSTPPWDKEIADDCGDR